MGDNINGLRQLKLEGQALLEKKRLNELVGLPYAQSHTSGVNEEKNAIPSNPYIFV